MSNSPRQNWSRRCGAIENKGVAEEKRVEEEPFRASAVVLKKNFWVRAELVCQLLTGCVMILGTEKLVWAKHAESNARSPASKASSWGCRCCQQERPEFTLFRFPERAIEVV
jgi:hypothetical protein